MGEMHEKINKVEEDKVINKFFHEGSEDEAKKKAAANKKKLQQALVQKE